jgi:hypothetical protein
MFLTSDLSKLDPATRAALIKHLQHEDAAQLAIEKAEQARVAQLYRNVMRPGDNPHGGIGQRHSVVHVGLQNRLAAQYGHDVAWNDPEFRQWLLKHEDAFRVPDCRTKISSGWTPQTPDPKPQTLH